MKRDEDKKQSEIQISELKKDKEESRKDKEESRKREEILRGQLNTQEKKNLIKKVCSCK